MLVYHSTKNENVEHIKREGLIVDPPRNGFTYPEFWNTIVEVYGKIPVHVSLNEARAGSYWGELLDGYTQLKINLPDSFKVHMRPDLGHLVELGAYIEEDEIYFKRNKETPAMLAGKKLKHISIREGRLNTEFYTKLTGTACIMESIPPEYIT